MNLLTMNELFRTVKSLWTNTTWFSFFADGADIVSYTMMTCIRWRDRMEKRNDRVEMVVFQSKKFTPDGRQTFLQIQTTSHLISFGWYWFVVTSEPVSPLFPVSQFRRMEMKMEWLKKRNWVCGRREKQSEVTTEQILTSVFLRVEVRRKMDELRCGNAGRVRRSKATIDWDRITNISRTIPLGSFADREKTDEER